MIDQLVGQSFRWLGRIEERSKFFVLLLVFYLSRSDILLKEKHTAYFKPYSQP